MKVLESGIIAAVAVLCLLPMAKASDVASASPKETHYVGLGAKRSFSLLTFPIKHPIATFHKLSYPARHPLIAFEKFGHLVEPYQPGMNFISAASGPATAAGIFSIRR